MFWQLDNKARINLKQPQARIPVKITLDAISSPFAKSGYFISLLAYY